jgi:hypothetical protein
MRTHYSRMGTDHYAYYRERCIGLDLKMGERAIPGEERDRLDGVVLKCVEGPPCQNRFLTVTLQAAINEWIRRTKGDRRGVDEGGTQKQAPQVYR